MLAITAPCGISFNEFRSCEPPRALFFSGFGPHILKSLQALYICTRTSGDSYYGGFVCLISPLKWPASGAQARLRGHEHRHWGLPRSSSLLLPPHPPLNVLGKKLPLNVRPSANVVIISQGGIHTKYVYHGLHCCVIPSFSTE